MMEGLWFCSLTIYQHKKTIIGGHLHEQITVRVAYYYEYLPYDRLDEDIKMMKAAGINVVRIAESTWSTYEKQEGQFDFSTVTKSAGCHGRSRH